jgi:hypothetical protein
MLFLGGPDEHEKTIISAKPVEVLGCVSAIDSNGRTIWIVDARRDD